MEREDMIFERVCLSVAFIFMMRAFAILGCLGLLWPGGCCNSNKQVSSGIQDRLNPPDLLTMRELADSVNSNNQRITSIWATLNYSATINDHGQVHSVTSDDGVLLYIQPNNFRLVGKQPMVGTVFDLGSNANEYWMEVVPGTNRMWWGTYADLAHLDPGTLPIPIKPQLVMEVLGIQPIDTDFTQLPAPVLRYDSATDSYVLTFIIRVPDRLVAEKEAWYDRQTLRPRRIVLFDVNGRPVLKAELSRDMKVRAPDQAEDRWPAMAGDYKLFFPDSGSRMEFTLKDVRLYTKLGRVQIPNPASFRLPKTQGTDIRAIQIGGGGGIQ